MLGKSKRYISETKFHWMLIFYFSQLLYIGWALRLFSTKLMATNNFSYDLWRVTRCIQHKLVSLYKFGNSTHSSSQIALNNLYCCGKTNTLKPQSKQYRLSIFSINYHLDKIFIGILWPWIHLPPQEVPTHTHTCIVCGFGL